MDLYVLSGKDPTFVLVSDKSKRQNNMYTIVHVYQITQCIFITYVRKSLVNFETTQNVYCSCF